MVGRYKYLRGEYEEAEEELHEQRLHGGQQLRRIQLDEAEEDLQHDDALRLQQAVHDASHLLRGALSREQRGPREEQVRLEDAGDVLGHRGIELEHADGHQLRKQLCVLRNELWRPLQQLEPQPQALIT